MQIETHLEQLTTDKSRIDKFPANRCPVQLGITVSSSSALYRYCSARNEGAQLLYWCTAPVRNVARYSRRTIGVYCRASASSGLLGGSAAHYEQQALVLVSRH